jgi:hypothetical protein
MSLSLEVADCSIKLCRIEFPLPSGTTDGNQIARLWEGPKPLLFLTGRCESAGRISDGEWQGKYVRRLLDTILGCGDKEIDIVDSGSWIANLNKSSAAARLAPNKPSDGHALIAQSNYEIRPRRRKHSARRPRQMQKLLIAEESKVPESIVTEPLGFVGPPKGIGEGS